MVTQLLNTEYCDRRDPSGGRGTAPIGGDGECPGGNARMEAGAGWRGGADGRKGIHRFCFCKNNKESIDFVSVRTIKGRSITPSISVEHADTGGGGWGGRGRASGHGRGRQDRRGARCVARPAPGTAAGGRAIRGAVSTIAQHGTSADNKSTRLGGGQDNGELSDVAQKYGTTPGTASAVFPRLGYAIPDRNG